LIETIAGKLNEAIAAIENYLEAQRRGD